MKKTTILILAFGLLSSLAAVPASAQTAQDILDKMIEAQGGRKALENIKDTTSTLNAELVQFGMSGTVTMYLKEPNKLRMDMEFMGMVMTQAYDGKTAWGTNMETGQVEALPESDARSIAQQALGYEALLNPGKMNITYTLKPKAEIEGKEYIVLEQTLSDGLTVTQYIDPTSYHIYRADTMTMGQMGVEVPTETYFSDYRKVGDIVAPHVLRIVQEGAEFITMSVTNMSFNDDLDDALFMLNK